MTFRHRAVRVMGILLLGSGLAAAPPARPAKPPEPVRDPVCIGWNNGWVVYRYEPRQEQWLMWTSPPTPKPLQALSAVGPHHAAVVDPRNQLGGWIFDLHTQKWQAIPASPFAGPPASPATVTVAFMDRQLIVWGQPGGGRQGGIFDPATMQWKPMSAAPVASRYRAATAVAGKKLLVWGGYGQFDQANPRRFGALTDGAVYDREKDEWEKMPDTPVPMANYGYVWATWKDRLVLFGGRTGQTASRTGLIYDPAARTWETIVQTPFAVGQQSTCAVHGDRLFLWSGHSVDQANRGRAIYTRDAAVYDFIKKEWQKLPEAPIEPRVLAFRHVEGDQITMWGGWISGNRGGTFLRDGATYDMKQGVWRKLPDLPGEVPYVLHPGW